MKQKTIPGMFKSSPAKELRACACRESAQTHTHTHCTQTCRAGGSWSLSATLQRMFNVLSLASIARFVS